MQPDDRRLVPRPQAAVKIRSVPPAPMEFRILGPLEVLDAGAALTLGGAKQRALLAILLLSANRVVPNDRLIDDLWGEKPPETAAHALQVYVSQLRKVLGRERLVTRSPGYLLAVEPDSIDLTRFEQLLGTAREQLGPDPAGAARLLGEALDLWRGPALAEFAFEPFAQNAIGRLEELRLVALEERIEADLALGRHGEVTGELEGLIRSQPLRERPRGQLMRALYRAGRQAEALEAYQETRRVLVDELGIDPSPALQQLEKAILNQDPALDAPASAPAAATARAAATGRSILLVPRSDDELDAQLQLAEPLARSTSPHELVLARLVSPAELAQASATLHDRRAGLLERSVSARAAAFTSDAWEEDVCRLSEQQEVDLLLLHPTAAGVDGDLREGPVKTVLERAPSDVALLARSGAAEPSAVLVPFGGGEHEWGALELGAWLAGATGSPLRLLGTEADAAGERRDASRLLATAALAVQQLAGVVTEPVLLPPGAASILDAATEQSLLVMGLSPRWRQDGLGALRAEVVAGARAATVVVRRGVRPGGLSPPSALTRFTWSLDAAT